MKNSLDIRNIFNGAMIGVSNVVPGVSGGTVAVMLGIYEKLLLSVKGLKNNFKENLTYLIQICLGAGLGIVLFSGLMSLLLDKYTIPTNYFFIGLVVGSIGVVFGKIENKKVTFSKILLFILGVFTVIGISVVGNKISVSSVDSIATGVSSYLTLGFAGFVAAITMLLPGVSGSLTLVMIGLYDDVINAISTFNIPVLFVCGIGVIVGLLVAVKIISYLMNNYNDLSYSGILGLVVGSVIIIFLANPIGGNMIVSIIMLGVGFISASMITKIAVK